MRNKKTLAIAVAVVAMVQPVLAATSLCVDSGVTGFDWTAGAWVQNNYIPEQYLIKEVGPDDPIGSMCFSALESQGLWSPGQPALDNGVTWGCFTRTRVGSDFSPYNTNKCLKAAVSATELSLVNCTYDAPTIWKYQPSGEIMTTYLYSATMPARADGSRDSLAIAVGKCTVIAP